MAAALLGKCVVLLALIVLLYTCCYGFRIRDGGPQLPSIEQPQQSTCATTFGGRCMEKTTSSATGATSSPWRKHESVVTRTVGSKKPPVDVATSDKSSAGFAIRSPKIEEVEEEDDDEDEVVIEVDSEENIVVSSEQVVDDSEGDFEVKESDEDDDDDEFVDEVDNKVGRRDLKKKIVDAKVISNRGDIIRDKFTRYTTRESNEEEDENDDADADADDDDDDDGDDEVVDMKKTEAVKKAIRKIVERPIVIKKYEKTIVKISEDSRGDADDDDDKTEKDKDEDEDGNEDEDEDEDGEVSDGDEDEDEDAGDDDEDEDDEENVETTTPLPRKLEKVRHADKDKIKSAEVIPEKPVSERQKEKVKMQDAEPKKQDESKKQKEELKRKKEEVKEEKIEAKKEKTESTKQSVQKKEKEDLKKLPESSKKPETPKPVKVISDKTKPEIISKQEDKSKTAFKSEIPKQQKKEEQKKPDEKKIKKDSKLAPPVSTKAPKLEKKESKSKETKQGEASITLAELNDAILNLPTFVPNFTTVEDSNCQQHGKIFLRQLRGYKLWALQMLDSSAKVPSGLLRGNVNQLGDFDQCLGITAHVKLNEQTIKIQGKYCLATIDIHATHPNMKLPVNLMQGRALIRGNMRDPGHFVPRFTTINWALCLPAACSAKDAESTLEHALSQYNVTSGIRFTVDVDPDMCYVRQKSSSYSKETIGVLYFYAVVICLVIVATVRDYLVTFDRKGNYSERIIMSFSLRRTIQSLLKEEGPGNIMCIHGIRAISTIALYIAHQLIPVSLLPMANRISLTETANNPFSCILRASFVFTDSFLLLSGVLTAYNMAKELTRRGEIRWFCRFVARFIRLTPALLVVVFWYAFVMEHTGSGPQWNSVIMTNAELCKKNAWTNLLYIQNFFPFEEMCATHTHQLALDMQLSLIAPVLVFFLHIKLVIGIILIFFFILISATVRYMAMMNNYLSLVIFHGMSLKHLYKTANLTYSLSLHRATPYIFGITLGVLLQYTGRNVKIHKVFVILGWLVAVALGSWSIFSPWQLARRDYVYDVEDATRYAVISPVSWALTMCWIIFACFTGHGGIINRFLSNHWLVVFSRISYAVYLTQFAVFFYNVGTTRYSTEFQLHRAIDPLEASTVIIVSVILTLLFDLPMQEVKSVIMESTDMLTVDVSPKEEETVEDKDKQKTGSETTKIKDEEIKDFEDDEVISTGWDWQKDIANGGAKRENKGIDDEEYIEKPVMRKPEVRRRSFIKHDDDEEEEIPTWDWIKGPKRSSKGDEEYMEKGRRSRNSQRTYDSEEEIIELLRAHQQREDDLRRTRRSLSRSSDVKRYSVRDGEELEDFHRKREDEDAPLQLRRSESKGRLPTREVDDHTWEFIGKERSSSRGPEIKKYSNITIQPDEHEHVLKPVRVPPSKSADVRRTLSSESEEEQPIQARLKIERKPSVEPRISDEEDWEHELKLRRKKFMEKLADQERESKEEEDTGTLKRRSSAEGRIALLKDPTGNDNMDSWTVTMESTISQLGSSHERSEAEDENELARRRSYRESAPPSRDDVQSEEESSLTQSRRRSYTSESQRESMTSFEDEEDLPSFNFALSKRISLQDLSKMSQEESDLAESGWNLVKKETSETAPKLSPTGLYKRESIIKSQASEEDPEYYVPERPKLVQQEREHPFKKAWQMQKSRSEEDAYIVKGESGKSETEEKWKHGATSPKRELSGEDSEDIGALADDETDSSTVFRGSGDMDESRRESRSGTDTDSTSLGTTKNVDNDSRPSSKSEEECTKMDRFSDEEQLEDVKRRQRSKSEEASWEWEQEET